MTVDKDRNGIRYLEMKGDANNDSILIFLPGLGAYKENYICHLRSFITEYSAIYSIDLPEQGSKGIWTIGNMVDNLKEFINEIDNPKIINIHLAGHSAGALCILSFVFNYNSKIEEAILKIKNDDKFNYQLNTYLTNSEFAKMSPENKKVKKLVLYSPPDSFKVVFPEKLSRILKNKNRLFIKKIMNVLINKEMIFLNYFNTNKYFKFELDTSDKPQYFGLVLNDHKMFFDYVERYHSIFEIQEKLNEEVKVKMSNLLEDKIIFVQYGSNDWLLKPFFGRKHVIENRYRINKNVKLKKHKFLGHLLSKKMGFDVNLNRQMITNLNVIKETKTILKE